MYISQILIKNMVLSVLSNHCLSENHEFDWKDIKTLDKKSFFVKKTTSEMVYI